MPKTTKSQPASDAVSEIAATATLVTWHLSGTLLVTLFSFLAGATLAWLPSARVATSEPWTTVLIAAATLCVGFGAAALVFDYMQRRQALALRSDFAALRSRADELVDKFDAHARNKRKS